MKKLRLRNALRAFFEDFIPPPTRIDARQRILIVGGVFIGIALTALICGLFEHDLHLKWWLMAPLGASAAQVFAVPVVVPQPGEYVALGAAVQAAWALTGARPGWELPVSAEPAVDFRPGIRAAYVAV